MTGIGPPEAQAGPPKLPDPPPEIAYVIDAFREALERQFTLAERLTSKARQAFVVSIGFFTIVQTVAFNSFQAREVRGSEVAWLLALAIASIIGLAVSAFAVVRSDSPVEFGDFRLDRLGELVESAYRRDHTVPARLAETYYSIVEWLRESNLKRDIFYRWSVLAAGVSIALSTAELISALAFRIP
jgi:hypothetical protein